MGLYDIVRADVFKRKQQKEKGVFNGIPWPFKRHRDYIPSIDKGMYYGFLGATGLGKSKLARHLFVYEVFKFSQAEDYPVKVLYFALEDGRIKVYKKFFAHYLWEFHNVKVPLKMLESKFEPLPDKYMKYIDEDEAFFRIFDDTVHVIDDKTSPKEITDVCERAHAKFGDTHHIITIVDNYSNITEDQHHKSQWEAIREFSRNDVRLNLCKKRDMTVIGILQQDFEQEKHSFRAAGKAMISTVEPNMGSVGDAKVVCKDMFVILALFSPWKYELMGYMGSANSEGYKIDILRNRFRSLINLKNNDGEMSPRLPLYFDGLTENFDELPMPTDKDAMDRIYQQILLEERQKFEGVNTLFTG